LTAEGSAFKSQPTKGDNTKARGRESCNLQGKFWIGTYENYNGTSGKPGTTQSDRPTGTLTSVEFVIEMPFLNFLVGGGAHKETSVRLLVGGKNYYLASGANSEEMRPVSADVSQFSGQKAALQILDQAKSGWGHINADNFTASGKALAKVIKPILASKVKIASGKRPPKPLSGPAQERSFTCEQTYLLLPIDNNGPKPAISLSIGGQDVRFVTGTLAAKSGDVDWWAFFDISEYKGKEATLQVSGLADVGFALIRQAATVPGSETWGDEAQRPIRRQDLRSPLAWR
jgi:hypothetical protein